MQIIITNWPALVEQWDYKKGEELLKKLSAEVSKTTTEEELLNISVDFDEEKTEAIVLFELKRRTKDFPSKLQTLRYEWRGTAN